MNDDAQQQMTSGTEQSELAKRPTADVETIEAGSLMLLRFRAMEHRQQQKHQPTAMLLRKRALYLQQCLMCLLLTWSSPRARLWLRL